MNEWQLDKNAARRLAIIRHAREVTGNVALTSGTNSILLVSTSLAGPLVPGLQIRLPERVLACWFLHLPVLLVAAPPCPPAAVSRLAKRPAPAGLAWTRRTRPRSSSSEEDGIISKEGVFSRADVRRGLRV